MNLNFFCRNIKLKNVVVNFQKLIYNIDDVILMISFNKEEIDSMLLIQQNFAKILLAYIEKLVSSSNNVDVKYSDDMIKILENFKKSLEHCNENIASLQNINEDSDMEITNFVYFLYSSELIFKLSL